MSTALQHAVKRARWVACSKYASVAASRHRHIVRRGEVTSACGCTATEPGVWHGNRTKPKCPECLVKAPDPEDG